MMKNSEKTVYLHIGHNKTGTTSIQYFLFKNKKILEKYNISYPVLDQYEEVIKINDSNAPNLRSLHSFGSCDTGECVKGLHVLLKKGEESPCSKILLTEEFLSGSNEFARTVFEEINKSGYNVKIIIYIRPIASYCTSFFYQHVKKNRKNLMSLSTILEKLGVPCSSLIYLIEKYGKDNVIIRPYEKSEWKNNNIIEDFLDILDIPLTNEFSVEYERNTSKGRNTAELMRAITLLEIDRKNFSVTRMENACSHDVKIVDTLTDAEILAVTERHSPFYKKLANIYGKESLFVNEFPSCYGQERPVYDKVTLSMEQYAILLEALEKNKHEKEEMQELLEELLKKPYPLQCHVTLSELPNWNDTFTQDGDTVFFTLEQHNALIEMLKANKEEKDDMRTKIEGVLGKYYLIWKKEKNAMKLQIEKLQQEKLKSKQEKDAMNLQLEVLQNLNKKQELDIKLLSSSVVLSSLKFTYLFCRIAAAITFGKARQRYKNEKKQLKKCMTLIAKL